MEDTDPIREFAEVMRRLRRECPWKAEQTHASLIPYLLEETSEAAEALESGDAEHTCEELGDVLLQVVFHAVIAEESGEFTLDDVARGITAKMRRRNPHVFGELAGGPALTADEVDVLWERQKALERGAADRGMGGDAHSG